MNHDLFLADIVTSMPAIGGAFLFSPRDGVLATHSGNASVSFNSLAVAGKMAAVAVLASNQFQDLTQLQVSFDTLILSGRLLPDGNWLCLLYTPDLSVGMIRMALQIALNNSAQGHHDETSPAPPPVQEAPVAEQLPPQEAPRAEIAVDTDALLAPGAPLAAILNALQGGLAHCIGPVAAPVFHELLVAWCQKHTPSTETMKHLITLIEEEIDDEKSVKEFHNKIKNILPQE